MSCQRSLPCLVAALVTLAAVAPARAQSGSPPAAGFALDRALTWDLNLEAGYGRIFTDPRQTLWQYRARGGLLLVRDSLYAFAGLTWEPTNHSAQIVGAQVEVLQLQAGTWLQLGANLDFAGAHPGFVAAGGVSLFGVEAQYRAHDDRPGAAWSLAAKLRLPLGVIAHALSVR